MIELKDNYQVLGVMSGTSLDGLDLALCQFNKAEDAWDFSIKEADTIPFTKDLKKLLKGAFFASAAELAMLDSHLGAFIGSEAKAFLKDKGEVDFIASHGQTVFHEPDKGFTLQIGKGAEVAAKSGYTTICDFRSGDVAKGGQGAPLVPIGDMYLFSEYDACINIGGFANLSYSSADGKRIAYDICPVNFVLNRMANKLGLEYDDAGRLASKGQVMLDLYSSLNANSYFSKEEPKTLGQEWVEDNVFSLLEDDYDVQAALRSYCEHASLQIAKALEQVSGTEVLFTGGGVYNTFLMELIKSKTKKKIVVPEPRLIDSKEALIFAFLGVLRVRGEVNSLASVTGASEDTVNGAIYLP